MSERDRQTGRERERERERETERELCVCVCVSSFIHDALSSRSFYLLKITVLSID